MEESLQLRKQKALARAQDRRLLAKGKLRLEQLSLAATVDPRHRKPPLILRRVKIPDES